MTFFQPGAQPEDRSQSCPICGAGQPSSPRFPDYVCADCVDRAVDEEGRPIEIFNESALGGVEVRLRDSGGRLHTRICQIDGRRCEIWEGRFGGIVVRPAGVKGE